MDWERWTQVGGREGWKQFVDNPVDPRVEATLRKCTANGAPFGDDEFRKRIEEKCGRVWPKLGRPEKARST